MEIHQHETGHKGKFHIEMDGHEVARMFYVWAGDKRIIIEHTETDKEAEGRGLGKKLVMHAVEFARKSAITIVPLCPFTKRVFDKTPEIRDVLSV